MSLYSDTLSIFQGIHALLLLLNAACLAGNSDHQFYSIYSIWFDSIGLKSEGLTQTNDLPHASRAC
jgi:hypothetical protein